MSIEDRIDFGIYIDPNFIVGVDEIILECTDISGQNIDGSFLIPSEQNVFDENTSLQIICSRLNPNIFLPADTLTVYRLDAQIFFIVAGILFFCAVFVVVVARKWRTLLSKSRRY